MLTEPAPHPQLFFPHTHFKRVLVGCPDKLDSQFLRSKAGRLRIGIQLLPLIGLDCSLGSACMIFSKVFPTNLPFYHISVWFFLSTNC